MTPFRFATQARTATDARQWREKARKAEELGYSSLLVPDHLNDHWAPLVSLTIAAEATSTLKVGSLMFNNEYRHPLLLAREFAVLAKAGSSSASAPAGRTRTSRTSGCRSTLRACGSGG